MVDVTSLIRADLRDLIPYSNARSEFKGEASLFLDANESPFGNLNRYPDSAQTELRDSLARLRNLRSSNCAVGNGSDEMIDLIIRFFCTPFQDRIAVLTPSYGMYAVSAKLNGVEVAEIPLNDDFNLNQDTIQRLNEVKNLKIIFLCSPNNPTGNTLSASVIEQALTESGAIVVIDEAYIDFSDELSWSSRLNEFPNLIVLQTMSKAWGLAGARVGMAIANAQVIEWINTIKPPYNISALNAEAALDRLAEEEQILGRISVLLKERERLQSFLRTLDEVVKVYPSQANFLLVEFKNATSVYESLIKEGIVVRDRQKQVANCLRISIGSPSQNTQLIEALNNMNS